MEAGTIEQVGVVPADTVINKISFWLFSLPGSLNDIYELNRHDSGLPRKRLKAEWSQWCSRMGYEVPLFSIADSSVLRVDRAYYLPWFYNNGNWRRVDVINMDALLFNMVTRKLGIDDCRVKCGYLDSRDSQENKVLVTITEVTESEWRKNESDI